MADPGSAASDVTDAFTRLQQFQDSRYRIKSLVDSFSPDTWTAAALQLQMSRLIGKQRRGGARESEPWLTLHHAADEGSFAQTQLQARRTSQRRSMMIYDAERFVPSWQILPLLKQRQSSR